MKIKAVVNFQFFQLILLLIFDPNTALSMVKYEKTRVISSSWHAQASKQNIRFAIYNLNICIYCNHFSLVKTF